MNTLNRDITNGHFEVFPPAPSGSGEPAADDAKAEVVPPPHFHEVRFLHEWHVVPMWARVVNALLSALYKITVVLCAFALIYAGRSAWLVIAIIPLLFLSPKQPNR